MAASISVVIPSYNSKKTVARTLASLRVQTRPDLLREVIVADSSGDGRTRDVLGAHAWDKLTVLDIGERVMPAAARNAGAARATGDFLFFVDSDAYLASDALERLAAHIERGKRVGGGSIALPPFQKRNVLAAAQFFLQFNEFMDRGPARRVPFAPSCNLFCEAALFRACGGFPEIRASEDVLFGLKAGETAPFWFLPDVKAYHVFREEARPFFSNQFLLGKYVLVYRRMKGSPLLYRGPAPLLLLPAFLALKAARIAARVFRAGPNRFAHFLAVSPAFAAGLAFWAAGFVRGAFQKEALPRNV